MQQGLPYIHKTLARLSAKLVELNEKQQSSSSDSELSDDEYEKALNKLASMRAKKDDKESGMKDDKKEGESDDSDSDIGIDEDEDEMAKEAGDFTLYYSPLDSTHELYYVKTKIEGNAMKEEDYDRVRKEGHGAI